MRSVVVLLSLAASVQAQPLPTAPDRVPRPTPTRFTAEVQSTRDHDSIESARRDALERAQEAVCAILRQQNPPIEWVPDIDYIQKLVVQSHCEQQDLRDEPHINCMMYREKLHVALTEADLRSIARHDRDYRAVLRMTQLAQIAFTLFVALAGYVAYVRLDNVTSGFYTARLRVVALAAVVILCVGGLTMGR